MGDLVPILRSTSPEARLYVNDDRRHMLAPYPRPALPRQRAGGRAGVGAGPRRGRPPLPIRFRAFRSRHAPHLGRLHFFQGVLKRDWRGRGPTCAGATSARGRCYAFVFDLLDADGRVRFRLYANDTASPREWGVPEAALARERRFDLAALTMASYYLVEEYPERLLGALRPRHVLAIHYEDFFQPLRPAGPLRPDADRRPRQPLPGAGGDGRATRGPASAASRRSAARPGRP